MEEYSAQINMTVDDIRRGETEKQLIRRPDLTFLEYNSVSKSV